MKCNLEWLSVYLDGLLSDDNRAKLEEHLKTCEACTVKLDEFAQVEQTARKIPAPRLSEAYWENFASRVQNKLTIRERQKTSPAWLKALKKFFRPTTGKLAIAGSVAVIFLLTFVSFEQWKKESFRPPEFKAAAPTPEVNVDSIQKPAKDEPALQSAERDKKDGPLEAIRPDQLASERTAAPLSQRPTENVPAASATFGTASDASERQKSKEEPSLAGYLERDEAVRGNTDVVTTGKKAENRREVATSQQKRAVKRIERLPIRTIEELRKLQESSPPPFRIRARTPSDTSIIKKDAASKPGLSDSITREYTLIQGGFDAQYGGKTMPSIDTAQLVTDIRRVITEKEKELAGQISNAKAESLYIFLGDYYLSLYRFSKKPVDWKKTNRRINDFLKKELSESARHRLLQIQAELKKLKK